MQGLPYQGHYWFYCSGCARPTIAQCCGQLFPWNMNYGDLPAAIQRARSCNHSFGFTPGYGGHDDFTSFLGTFMEVEGIIDGNPVEAALGATMAGGGFGRVAGAFAAAEAFEVLDDDRFGGGFDPGW